MKKTVFLFLTLMMLGINSATAQSHIGKWVADQEFSKQVNDDPNLKIDFVVDFTAKDINLQMSIKAIDEEMIIKCMYTIPGTYTKTGKNVSAKYSPEKAVFKIIDLKTNDAEINQLLASKETKDMIFKMVEDQAKSELKNQIEGMDEFIGVFRNFTIEKVTASKLTLGMGEGAMVSFDRKN